jgi:hypothetical protein
LGSTNGMTPMAETNPATLPTKLRYLSAFMVTLGRCQRLAAGAGENWFAGRLAACYRLFMRTTLQSVGGRSLHFQVADLPEQQPVRITIVKAARS